MRAVIRGSKRFDFQRAAKPVSLARETIEAFSHSWTPMSSKIITGKVPFEWEKAERARVFKS